MRNGFVGGVPGNHFSRSSLKKSCNSAANSIPVGPPPTTTMCNNRDISSGVWFANVAVSIQSYKSIFQTGKGGKGKNERGGQRTMMRVRIFVESHISLRKQACS